MIKRKLNSALARMEDYIYSPHFNLIKTIYFNFRTLPFKQAIKLPIFFYGPVRLLNLRGSVEIKSEIESGMIKFGRWYDRFYGPRGSSFIFMPGNSKIVFYGRSEVGIDYGIRLGDKGILELGDMAVLTSGVKISVNQNISIGAFTRITWNCRLVDTDFHFTWDEKTKLVNNNTKSIKLGAFNWIGNNSAINKGTVTPDYTIVASGSVVNKNYIKVNEGREEPILLAGVPACIVSKNKKRLYSQHYEHLITRYFEDGNVMPYKLPENFVDDYESIKLR